MEPGRNRLPRQRTRPHRHEPVASKAYVRLRQILTQAVNDDRIAKNPCRIDGGGASGIEQRPVPLEELCSRPRFGSVRVLVLCRG
jgi:hypothetical protein